MTNGREADGQNGLPERPQQDAASLFASKKLGPDKLKIVIEKECAVIQEAPEDELRRYLNPKEYVRALVPDRGDLPPDLHALHDAVLIARSIGPVVRARAVELGIDFEAHTLQLASLAVMFFPGENVASEVF